MKVRIEPGMTRLRMGGKSLKFANLPKDVQEKVSKRLQEKDPILKDLVKRRSFGFRIGGEEVTMENFHKFEIKPKKKAEKKLKDTVKKLAKKVSKKEKVNPEEKTVKVKEHDKDVIPGPKKLIKKIKSYTRRKPRKKSGK